MHTSSSTDRANGNPAQALPWGSWTIDWPCERVVVEAEVVAPREPTIFEWVLGRILEQFGSQPPTLEEAADELGINDLVFLKNTLQSFVELGAVESVGSSRSYSLGDYRLTAQGRQLLSTGRVSLTERHGLELYFDAITGEHLCSVPKQRQKNPRNPVLSTEALPERVSSIGLDRARHLAQAQGSPLHSGESRIQSVSVQPDIGGHIWLSLEVHVGIALEGVLRATLQGGTEQQQEWLNGRDLNIEVFADLDRVSIGAWANGRCMPQVPVSPGQWLSAVDHLVDPSSTAEQARDLIRSAEREVILHSGWLDAPEVESTLAVAAHRGVRCFVCGAEYSLAHWSAPKSTAPGFVASGGPLDAARPMALLADGDRGLNVNPLCVSTPGGRELTAQVAGYVKHSEVETLRQGLLSGLIDDLPTDDEQALFVRFVLSGELDTWEKGAQLIRRRTCGVAQVEALRRWAQWGQEIAGGGQETDWYAWAVRSWWEQYEALSLILDDSLVECLDLGVRFIPPKQILAGAAGRDKPVPVFLEPDILLRLVFVAVSVNRRWPQLNPVQHCSEFAEALKACLSDSDGTAWSDSVYEAVRVLSADGVLRAERKVWSAILSACVPAPYDLPTLLIWLEAHLPLKAYPALRSTAIQHVRRLHGSMHGGHGGSKTQLNHIRNAWAELDMPVEVLERHLGCSRHGAAPHRRSPAVAQEPNKRGRTS